METGFHGITEKRARSYSNNSDRIVYCEHVLTAKCNFKCSYCNVLDSSDDPSTEEVYRIIDLLSEKGCEIYHMTGGEPTIRPDIVDIVNYAWEKFETVRMSTNGSSDWELYQNIIESGCRSFAVSLDTNYSGDRQPAFDRVVSTIKNMTERGCDVQIGTVFDKKNLDKSEDIIRFISSLGVSDIKIGTASQEESSQINVDLVELMDKHKILKYRIERFRSGRGMRGLIDGDSETCHLCKDDVTVKGKKHYPCAVYLREGGKAIGEIGEDMIKARKEWVCGHDSLKDPICRKFCMDFKCCFNNYVSKLK